MFCVNFVKVFSNGSYKTYISSSTRCLSINMVSQKFDLCCAYSVVNVLGYVLFPYGTFKELSPLWGVFEKQPNFCHTAKHTSDFLNIMLAAMKVPGMQYRLLKWCCIALDMTTKVWLLHHMFEILYCPS